MNENDKIVIEEVTRKCISRLRNVKVSEEQIQSTLSRLYALNDLKTAMDSLTLSVSTFFSKPEQENDLNDCIKDIMTIDKNAYNSPKELLEELKKNKETNYTPGNISIEENHKLKNDLKNPDLDNLLDELGYSKGGINTVLRQLKERMTENGDFPHEIGAFLGYPPKDVIGFVKNKGSNCLCSGWWKVYHDAENAKKMFLKFDKCRELYKKLYLSGKTALQLAVAA